MKLLHLVVRSTSIMKYEGVDIEVCNGWTSIEIVKESEYYGPDV